LNKLSFFCYVKPHNYHLVTILMKLCTEEHTRNTFSDKFFINAGRVALNFTLVAEIMRYKVFAIAQGCSYFIINEKDDCLTFMFMSA